MLVNEIKIDREGNWYADGMKMERKEIVNLFSTHLWRNGENQYFICLNQQVFPIVVEDTPFIINEVIEEEGKLKVRLNDERVLDLSDHPIVVIKSIPYTSLFWERDAKFARHAFWQLSKYIVETDQGYLVKFGDTQIKLIFQQ